MSSDLKIVKSNDLIENFISFGVPCFVLDEWSNLDNLNEDILNDFFNKNIEICDDCINLKESNKG